MKPKKFICLSWFLLVQAMTGWTQKQTDSLLILDDGSYGPYCFKFSDKNGAQNVSGILVDIWSLWSRKTGVPIKFELANSFIEAIHKVEAGRKAVLCGICPKYRTYHLLYSKPYYSVIAQPIIRKEREVYFKTLADGNYIFGTCNGDVINDILRVEYKNIVPKVVDDYSNLIDSLLGGKVSGILLEVPVFKYTLFERGEQFTLKNYLIMPDAIEEPICSATTDSNLLKLVNAGFNRISSQEIKSIEDKWIKKYEPNYLLYELKKLAQWVKAHPIISPILAVCLLLLCINSWLLFIYFYRPWKLFSIKYNLSNLPEIKIPIKNLNISIKLFLILDFLIRSKRTYFSYYSVKHEEFLKIIIANLDLNEYDYLPFPVRVNEKSPGLLPLSNNSLIIKEHLQNAFSRQPILKIIISGNGGIGKTTFSLQIIRWILESRTFFLRPLTFVPIDFKSLDEALPAEEFKKIGQSIIFESFNSFFEKKADKSFFTFCINNCYIVLVIDGLSEYTSSKRSKIASFISSWEKDKIGLLITSRYIDYSISNFNIIIEPEFLKSAFLINLIQLVYMKANDLQELTIGDSRKINDLFILLNRITKDNGVTPLFCTLFSRELSSFTIPTTVSDNIGLNRLYEQMFTKYIERVIRKIQSVNSDNLEQTVDTIKTFAAFFAWKQISVEGSYSLNNYLSLSDLEEFPNAEENLKLLHSAGSFLIENDKMYKIKFDPIAELLVNLHLYKSTRNNINNKDLNSLLIEPYSLEKLSILQSFHSYLEDILIEDNRTKDLIVLVQDNINTIKDILKI